MGGAQLSGVIPRDPTDGRLRERTTASFIVSLFIHVLLAFFFISIITSSSEQSSPESTEGAPLLVTSHVRVTQRVKSAPPVIHPPLAHAPRIAKPQAHPVVAGHRAVPTHRELAKNNPKAPPNPTPAPIAPLSPNPAQTQVAIVTPAPAEVPAVPVNAPTAPPLIAEKPVSTPQPTQAPPTTAPSAKPSAAPVVAVTAKPVKATPQPTAAPSAAPTKAPAIAASSSPTQAPNTPAPKAVAAASPVPNRTSPGISSPAPSGAPSPSTQRGTNPSPGPKPLASSGAIPVPSNAKPQPPRVIQLPPPTPQPTAPPPTPRPKPTRTVSPAKQKAVADLNARLRALLPNGPVVPTTKRYTPKTYGTPGEPTPPPEVIAKTKFIYENRAVKGVFRIFGGHEQRVKMYVTSINRHGPITTCTGWLVRYPDGPGPYSAAAASGPFNRPQTDPSQNYPGPRAENGFMPIVEANVTFECESARLQPFVPSLNPSPAP